jgi:hypothetical protein
MCEREKERGSKRKERQRKRGKRECGLEINEWDGDIDRKQ